MADTVMKLRFWTIADFKEEEVWLREMAKTGLHFKRMIVPCFYFFEKGEPRDVIYRLDFTNNNEGGDYASMLADFGWENCGRCMGWIYWRRNADELADEREGELFSDDESRLALVKKVILTRMLPLMVIFLCCVLPNLVRALEGQYIEANGFFLWFFGIMAVLYVWLFIHCGGKLRRMQKELAKEE